MTKNGVFSQDSQDFCDYFPYIDIALIYVYLMKK